MFIYSCSVTAREEDIPVCAKEALTHVTVRTFKADKSVFSRWTADDPKKFLDMTYNDLNYAKLHKMIKDDDDRDNCAKVLAKYYEQIKHIFTFLAAKSAWPSINNSDYS